MAHSNPDVREAVRVMEGEVSLFSEILQKIETLSSDFREMKSQTQQLQEAVARQEAILQRETGVEPNTQAQGVTSQQPGQPDSQVDEVATLRLQLERQTRELEELRRMLREREGTLATGFQHASQQVFTPPRDPSLQNPAQPVPRHRTMTPEPPAFSRPPRQNREQVLLSNQECRTYERSASQDAQGISYVLARESVPHFRGDTTASQPLKKNQAIEGWIRAIENLVKPPTSQAFMQAARANCRGPAELIINSPLFDGIQDWEIFKASLRAKFRGTYTSSDFFKVLYENKMVAGQAPMDFYIQLEGSVYQGYRDHRDAIGDPSELIRRVFLSGLPSWLRDFLAVRDEGSPMQLAEAAQRVWNSRNGIQHGTMSSRQMPMDDLGDHHRFPERPPRARDVYAYPVAEGPSQLVPEHRYWCEHHKSVTHNTSECRAAAAAASTRNAPQPRSLICFRCRRPGHLAKDCPFPTSQDGRTPNLSGETTIGSSNNWNTDSRPNISHSSECHRTIRTTSRGTQS